MIDPETAKYLATPEFQTRLRDLQEQLQAGTQLSVEECADLLGLTWPAFAVLYGAGKIERREADAVEIEDVGMLMPADASPELVTLATCTPQGQA